MGTYLSTPVLEKCEESGETLNCPGSPLAWGVVDMQGWRKTMEDAHVACLDVEVPPHLDPKDDARQTAKVFGVFDGHGGPEVARFSQLYLVDVITKMASWKSNKGEEKDPVGRSLVAAFHALDRMIDDPERREELIRLRTEKPAPGERRTTTLNLPDGFFEEPNPPVGAYQNNNSNPTSSTTEASNSKAMNEENENTSESNKEEDVNSLQSVGFDEAHDLDSTEDSVENNDDAMDDSDHKPEEELIKEEEEIAQLLSSGHAELSIKKIEDGAVEIQVTDDDEDAVEGDEKANDGVDKDNKLSPAMQAAQVHTAGPSASVPTLVHNGRMVCNLPDHPIHAGCTAVVAVMIGRTLTIANAGDSRGVLCREGGGTEPLSFDHKPIQDREMNRITKAGGFVNQFGRVNGNLNLSRSIGDLKYKQVPGLSPAEQMITAEPDIITITLQPNDEFFILGCDGIWDCLTNEQAIKYVRDRIDSKKPLEIGADLLDEIISEDPRATQGIGGDNMTIMIVDLQPQKRKYH
mmetsp:Transcript_10434/g.14757  ORF Transcript_10434/g.14757 Transcript_10434/m.14757 type:complete len:520 (+) Transcript_10434:231-1790(+)